MDLSSTAYFAFCNEKQVTAGVHFSCLLTCREIKTVLNDYLKKTFLQLEIYDTSSNSDIFRLNNRVVYRQTSTTHKKTKQKKKIE